MPRTCITPGCRHDSAPGQFARYCRGCIREQVVKEQVAAEFDTMSPRHIEVEEKEGR